MKKAIVGVTAVAAVIALRPVLKRRMLRTMRAHCEQMMREFANGGEATDQQPVSTEAMRRHCEEMAAGRERRSEPVATAEGGI